ncbi:ABC-ATPase domain-containing protein [Leptolyngbya cf. ectocarpi LEGE 11479]|uniref:ABC-ATPase domain-containing protein n=1 Tax=Leptolyngbya cf. ectocarpi LEGE 11479 TaxID=1828722 RepID=A0A928ZV03_LEPEC|nr:ABC-ATPase domain-containing protein [Leptolyngbya ectocarpi]MBE9067938.1 ABC-ATPase domain-containing protein [Leptolyngbya cf. ectocarpi LEGE 11479]
MTTSHHVLEQQLEHLDGRSYSAYKRLKGSYAFPEFELTLAHIQGDPFAAPSRVSLWGSHQHSQWPEQYWQEPARRVVLADFLHRQINHVIPQIQQQRGSGKSGCLRVAPTSQVVLARTAVQVTSDGIELRLGVGLPAFGRRIAGQAASELLMQDLPRLVRAALHYQPEWVPDLEHHIATIEDANALRQQLSHHKLVAFIANGAILPRCSGVDPQPLPAAVPFTSPKSLEVTLQAPHAGSLTGLGIPEGVTLIVGGGYHGKSTVLKALSHGVYNHIPGDGREQVVANAATVKIRSEDGRSVTGVDISPFIDRLPQGLSTKVFSTTNASGSTSQAANILEAIEAGAKVLLIDEDTAATNLMIRDRNMQTLIAKEKEPITPFIDKVRQLYEDYTISTILVMGGSGDYFEVADQVIALDSYTAHDVTDQAKAIAAAHPSERQGEGGQNFGTLTPRPIQLTPFDTGRKPAKVRTQRLNTLTIGAEDIDLRGIEQLVEPNQNRAIAHAILTWQQQHRTHCLSDLLDDIMTWIDRQDFDALTPYPMADLSEFRRYELAAVINRLRRLKVLSGR